MMETPRDALAAQLFPKEWAAVAAKAGASKKRQQLRQRAEHVDAVNALRAKGASCASCVGFRPTPSAAGLKFAHHCTAESDFHGYVEARADGLCRLWRTETEK
jgi:hypothetical protein